MFIFTFFSVPFNDRGSGYLSGTTYFNVYTAYVEWGSHLSAVGRQTTVYALKWSIVADILSSILLYFPDCILLKYIDIYGGT